MRKFLRIALKIVFGRTMVTLVLLLVQLSWLFAVYRWLGEYSEVTFFIMVAISGALLVHIINKDEIPEFKLAWVIPICVAPVFGALLYLFIIGDWTNAGLKKRLNKIRQETAHLLLTDDKTKKKMGVSNAHMANLSRYVEQEGGFPTYGNSSVTYFSSGEEKFDDLLEELEKAQEFIFLEFFIVERGILWNSILDILKRKVEAGVEVRFMYDGMCSIVLLPYSYPKKLCTYGIQAKMFSPIRPLLSTAQNNRDHRKIAVIDGKIAYTGGVNLADEYINKVVKYGHWKDVAIKIEGDAVKSFTLMFLQMWNVSSPGNEDYSKYIRQNEKHTIRSSGFVMPYGDGPSTPENISETVYMDIINQATGYVHIMTPYFIVDNALLDVLQYAARRGVDVKIIVPHIPDKKAVFALSRTYYPDLLGAGVKIYEYEPGFIHAKLFVSDDEKAVVGTINLDYRSLYHHFECAAYMYRNEVVAEVEKDFQETLEKCIPVDMEYYKKIPILQRLLGRVLRLFGPLM